MTSLLPLATLGPNVVYLAVRASPQRSRTQIKLHIKLGSSRGRPPARLSRTQDLRATRSARQFRLRLPPRGESPISESGSASRFCDHFAKSATNSPDNGLHRGRLDPATQRTENQEVAVHGCYLITECNAVMSESARSGRQGNTCRAEPAAREQRDDDHVVGQSIPDVFGDDHGRSRLVRIIRLTWSRRQPNLALMRDSLSCSPSAHGRRRRRPAAARLVAFQATRSSALSSGTANWVAIASSWRAAVQRPSASSTILLRSAPSWDCTKSSTAFRREGSTETLTFTRFIRPIVA